MKNQHKTILLLITATLLLVSSINAAVAQTTDTPPTNTNPPAIQINTYENHTLTKVSSFSINDLLAMPKTTVFSDLSCAGRLIASGTWGGVSLGYLLEQAGFTEQTATLTFFASDGYTVPFSFSEATPKDVIVAYELDTSSLPEGLRLVIPNTDGPLWIGMISSISINPATYPISPNPDAAAIIFGHPTQEQIAPQPTATPQPTVKPTPTPTVQPTVPAPTNPPVHQQSATNSNLQTQYGYSILAGVIAAAVAALGFLFYKRRK